MQSGRGCQDDKCHGWDGAGHTRWQHHGISPWRDAKLHCAPARLRWAGASKRSKITSRDPRCRWEAVSGTTILGRTGRKDRTGRQVAKIELQDAASGDPITIGPDNSINIDLSKLPPPDKLYDADQAWVIHSGTKVSLFFGKRRLDRPSKFRTRLEIRYPPGGCRFVISGRIHAGFTIA